MYQQPPGLLFWTMKIRGFFAGGTVCLVVGVLLYAMAQSNNDLQSAIAAAGGDPGSDAGLVITALAFVGVALACFLVAIIAAGVHAAARDQRAAGSRRAAPVAPSAGPRPWPR